MIALLALAVAAAQANWPLVLAHTAGRYVQVWGATTLAAIAIAWLETLWRARRLHGPMADTMLSAALRPVIPFVATGAILTIVVSKYAAGAVWLLPGLWQILIGLLGFTLLPIVPSALVWVAVWYVLCGTFVLGLAGRVGSLSPWAMGLPLVIGQGAVALIVSRGGVERDEKI